MIFIFTDNILLRQQPSLSLMMCFIGYSLCYISRLPICQSIENNVNIQFMLNHYNHVVGSHLNEHVINSFSYCLFFVWTSGFLIKSTYAIHSRILEWLTSKANHKKITIDDLSIIGLCLKLLIKFNTIDVKLE